MMRALLAVMAVGISLVATASPSVAADPRNPDWPCVQIKVPELSAAAVWAGPAIDDVGNAWEKDPKVKDLVERIAARRTPVEEAEKAIAGFLDGPPAERQQKAKLVFAGLFDTLNRQRGEVIGGIERFTRHQRDFAARIRAETERMRDMQDAPSPDQAKLTELGGQIEWDTRIFEERRTTIRYVCEVPTVIEQRLFTLARAIQQALE
jgi:hypothetical protein